MKKTLPVYCILFSLLLSCNEQANTSSENGSDSSSTIVLPANRSSDSVSVSAGNTSGGDSSNNVNKGKDSSELKN